DANYQQWYDKFCSATYDELKDNQLFKQNIRTISPSLMTLVRHCLDNQQTGFMAWIATSQDRSTFTYFARYKPSGDERAEIKSFDILPKEVEDACQKRNAYPLFDPKKKAKLGNAPVSLACPVKPETTVTVTLNADKSG